MKSRVNSHCKSLIVLPLSANAQDKVIPLSKGAHVVEWITDRLIEAPDLTPLEITSIVISGGAGAALSCIRCPIVRNRLNLLGILQSRKQH